jgi:hypothetical protein
MSKPQKLQDVLPTLKQSWRAIVAGCAVITAMFATVKPEFTLTTKLSFGWFLLRVYWPEMVITVLLGAGYWLVTRRSTRRRPGSVPWGQKARRLRMEWREVGWADRLGATILLAILLLIFIHVTWHQFYIALQQQQVFVATRLMNWFGDDLHRVAAAEINQGRYETAIRLLKQQGKELGNLEEGITARTIGDQLAERRDTVTQLNADIRVRAKRAGVMRGDLLLMGALDAMLPQGPLGEIPRDEKLPFSASLPAYRDALGRIAKRCTAETDEPNLAADIGMAASALGFARWPSLLFGTTESPVGRMELLCRVVSGRDAAELDVLHKAAFSVTALAVRNDWRRPVPDSSLLTPAAMAGRAFSRAADTMLYRLSGRNPLMDFLPQPALLDAADATDEGNAVTWVLQPLEIKAVVLLHAPPIDALTADPLAFTSTRFINPFNENAVGEVEARLAQGPGGAVLSLCLPGSTLKARIGYSARTRPGGRLEITHRETCGDPPSTEERVRRIDAVLLTAIRRLIELADAGRVHAEPPEWRSTMCSILASRASEAGPTVIEGALRLCPIDAVAARLSRPAPPKSAITSNDISPPSETDISEQIDELVSRANANPRAKESRQ